MCYWVIPASDRRATAPPKLSTIHGAFCRVVRPEAFDLCHWRAPATRTDPARATIADLDDSGRLSGGGRSSPLDPTTPRASLTRLDGGTHV